MTRIPPAEKVGAVVPAAGTGERLSGPVPKQFRHLAGSPMIWHTLRRLRRAELLRLIVLVLPPSETPNTELPSDLVGVVRVAGGGSRRQDSVARGLAALPPEVEWVVVHDGARPLLPPPLVGACLLAAQETGAAIAALPVSDTLKRADAEGFSEGTLPREKAWLAQTPQVARRDLLCRAIEAGGRAAWTDESAMLESIGVRVKLVMGAKENLKITTPEDFALAEAYLARAPSEGFAPLPGEPR